MRQIRKKNFILKTTVTKAIEVLESGGLILYPTDTVWGIGCDATKASAVNKIFELKEREDSKALICLVSDKVMLHRYVKNVPKTAINIIDSTEVPTTIIYDNPIHIAQNLVAADNSIAIRIPHHEFCQELLKKFNKPIVSTSANVSTFPSPKSFKEISDEILKGVDYVVNLPDEKIDQKPSSIIKLSSDGKVKIIRE